jgi:hypothetical protein
MCFPTVGQVATTLRLELHRRRLHRVLIATNSVDGMELAELRALLPYSRWQPDSSVAAEWIPVVELILCARAAAFVGTLPSTFSASVIGQRDLLGLARNTSSFFGGVQP